MKAVLVSALLASAFAASTASCAGAAPAPAAPAPAPADDPFAATRAQVERETEALEALTIEMCDCRDVSCAIAVDRKLAAWVLASTMDDVMTDEPTWPPELDERAKVSLLNIMLCITRQGATLYSWGKSAVRNAQAFRDKMCACDDQACTRRVLARAQELDEKNADMPIDAETQAEIDELSAQLGACFVQIHGDGASQAVIELKALRARACDCADTACADQVRSAFDEFLERHAETKGDRATSEEVEEIAREMGSCLAQFPAEEP